MMTRRRKVWLAALPILVLSAGCGVQGTWVTKDVYPAEATAQFGITKLTLKPDMTYEAEFMRAGEVSTLKGRYTYDDMTRMLRLKHDGRERKYLTLIWFGQQLRLDGKTKEGLKISATLEREKTEAASDEGVDKRCPTCGRPM